MRSCFSIVCLAFVFAFPDRIDGVLCVKKAEVMTPHHYIATPNLYVFKLLKGLFSQEFVTETYAWKYLYYTLTESVSNFYSE